MANNLTKVKIQKAIDKFISDNNKKAEKQDAILDHSPDYEFEKYYWKMGEDTNIETLLDDSDFTDKPINGLKFEQEDEKGGYEGGGDECYRVVKVTDVATGAEAYIKYDGYYNSYDGSSYDDGFYFADYDLVQVKKWKKKGKK